MQYAIDTNIVFGIINNFVLNFEGEIAIFVSDEEEFVKKSN